jgi:hypothetical protein
MQYLFLLQSRNTSLVLISNRYNDLYRDLERRNIGESVVRLVLINEQEAARALTNNYYNQIEIFQDTPKDRLIQKLGQNGQRMNNLVFGR